MEPLSGQLQQAAPAYPSNVAIQENVKVLLSSLGGSLLGQIPGCPPLVDRFTLQVPLLGGQAFLSCAFPSFLPSFLSYPSFFFSFPLLSCPFPPKRTNPNAGGVVMDAMRPEVPPDFIFPPGDEASFRLSELRSLANWRCAFPPAQAQAQRQGVSPPPPLPSPSLPPRADRPRAQPAYWSVWQNCSPCTK